MRLEVTAEGKTVDEAISSALQQLETTRENVQIEVVQEPRKGWFGLFARPALVNARMIESEPSFTPEKSEEFKPSETEAVAENTLNIEDETKQYIQNMLNAMDLKAEVVFISSKEREAWFDIRGEDIAQVIGKRGQTLNAFQQLAQAFINHHDTKFRLVMLDAEGYRGRRKETLEQLAVRMAYKAKTEHVTVQLDPMPSFERKIIHHVLQKYEGVVTESAGQEPNRFIRIRPTEVS
ncbi:protein jag [Bacillaceae bacterium SIJ1]|uniref:RNA-binding cell elongation regulator Jag/EloR n=1 Tax=Litoribacterium kuwaitense TaxID=1398745 RepID=UPI0013EC26FC|nr:RNA-binding cell elongation regulator Jag/EloR [Litoribacterium kuwaitense]NGP45200.1 protein jag [Litoribacterium kuwaitense]